MSLTRGLTLERAIVSSVALSCLLAMDYVPKAKPPPIEEMIRNELPHVLATILQVETLGLALEGEMRHGTCADPADLLRRVAAAVRDPAKAAMQVLEHGHRDMVFSALMYTRKPPTASSRRIERMTRDVARVLQVDVPDEFDGFIGDMYDATHGVLVRA